MFLSSRTAHLEHGEAPHEAKASHGEGKRELVRSQDDNREAHKERQQEEQHGEHQGQHEPLQGGVRKAGSNASESESER